MANDESLIPEHGGYRKLLGFQVAQLAYDITVRFCDKYVDRFSRTRDQMVQAARSGVQNIAEGSLASATSKKTELKLTQVARASLEELKLDYEDFLRHRKFKMWDHGNPLRQRLIDRRCLTVDDVAYWVYQVSQESDELDVESENIKKELIKKKIYPEVTANAALVLITVACAMIDRQMKILAKNFVDEGGFTERLYRVRKNKRQQQKGY